MGTRRYGVSAMAPLVILALAGALVFSTSAAPRRGGTLRIAEIGEPLTLDTVATTADVTSIITLPIFEELFTYDAGWKIQPLTGGECLVSHYCDWTNISDELRARFRWPVVPVDRLQRSAENLDRLATRPASREASARTRRG